MELLQGHAVYGADPTHCTDAQCFFGEVLNGDGQLVFIRATYQYELATGPVQERQSVNIRR